MASGEKKRGDVAILSPEEGLKDKLKKAKKPGRAREEEDVKFRADVTRWQDLRAIPVHRREDRSRHLQPSPVAEITKPRKKIIKLSPGLTVKEFAELVGQRPGDLIRKFMEMGQMLTMNQPVNLDAAVLLAESVGVKVELATEKQGEALLEEVVGDYGGGGAGSSSAGCDDHGACRPRENVVARCHQANQGDGARSRRNYAAHWRLCRAYERQANYVLGHARP